MKKIILILFFSIFAIYNCIGQSLDSLKFNNDSVQATIAINFKVLATDVFTFEVYDRWGNIKATPINYSTLNPGSYSVSFDTKGFINGIYIYYFYSSLSKLKGNLVINNSISTSIKKVEKSNIDFSVYPNPTIKTINTQTTINFNNLIIYDLSGKQITSVKCKPNTEIDISALSKGEYIFTFLNDQTKVYTSRVIQEE